MICNEQNPVIALVVDRVTRKVLDCERYTYGPYVNTLLENHDLTKVDVILRQATATIPTQAPEEELITEPAPMPSASEEDIPF